MKFEDIKPEEFEIYTKKLVPCLMRYPPGQWIRIDAIAKDVGRFIDICQCLYDHGYFEDENGFLILDIQKDSLVRLDPMYIRKHDTKTFKLWK